MAVRRVHTITLGGKNGQALGVNDAGVVVGSSQIGATPPAIRTPHAFRWQAGKLTDLGVVGVDPSFSSVARAINATGDVVGWGRPSQATATHAVVWRRGGRVVDLGVLGGSLVNTFSEATAINESGLVVGDSTTDKGVTHAFVYNGRRLFDLNRITSGIPRGIALSAANAVAADGTIVGSTCAQPSTCPPGAPADKRAFMLVPVIP